jgi:hypothetical protein
MNPAAMEPFGMALAACFEGETGAELIVRRDDGHEARLPARLFFRDEPAFTDMERTALARCRGRVLDIGAGAGSHSLIEISPLAADVARRRGVADVRCADVTTFDGGPFDTLLLLGHGIGMVQTVDGLRGFLARAAALLAPDGELLLDSLDVRVTNDPAHLAYQAANRAAGRYIGEIRMQFEFCGRLGPPCGWLQIDANTLNVESARIGWRCGVIHPGPNGNYLARLTQRQA